jgi:hypothetical protein
MNFFVLSFKRLRLRMGIAMFVSGFGGFIACWMFNFGTQLMLPSDRFNKTIDRPSAVFMKGNTVYLNTTHAKLYTASEKIIVPLFLMGILSPLASYGIRDGRKRKGLK